MPNESIQRFGLDDWYIPEHDSVQYGVVPLPDGEYVRFVDYDALQSQLEQLRAENERLKLSEDEVKVLTDYHYYESEKALTRRGDRASQHRHLERLAAMKSQYQGENHRY